MTVALARGSRLNEAAVQPPNVQSRTAISVSQVAELMPECEPELVSWWDGMSEPTRLPPDSVTLPVPGERRKFPRFPAGRAISGSLITPDRVIWVRDIADVSAGGVGLVLDYRADPGTFLLLDLYLPRSLPRILRVRVAHSREGPEGHFFIGGAFSQELREDELEELR